MRTTHQVLTDHATALSRLSRHPFAHLMTLKMLSLYGAGCTTTTYLSDDGWSCLTQLETVVSHWDRAVYPGYRRIALLDGDSDDLLLMAFAGAPREDTVFKVHDNVSESLVGAIPGAVRARTYLTYSSSAFYAPEAGAPPVVESDRLTPEAIGLFADNGYTQVELEEHFGRGSVWFGLFVEGVCRSACFIFRNYESIWEVAGVHTHPEHRGKGYARRVVRAALAKLTATGRIPRYQFRDDNTGSRAVAEGLGLEHILTVRHYTTPRNR